MNEALVAHRFQRLLPLRSGAEYRLDVARDVASDALGTLLTLQARPGDVIEVLVRMRLTLFAGCTLFRDLSPATVLADDDGVHFFLHAIEAHPWESQLLASDGPAALADLQFIQEGIAAHLEAGCPAGALKLETLYRDERGPFFLPDAYALPPVAVGMPGAGELHRDPGLCAVEVRDLRQELAALCRRYLKMASSRLDAPTRDELERMAREFLDELPEPPAPPRFEPLLETLEALREDGGCIVLRGQRKARAEALDVVRQWSRTSERRCVTLHPHVGPGRRSLRQRGEEASGPVVVLHDFDRHARFAEGLQRLTNAGWFDGREILVVAQSEAPLDGAAQLYLAGHRQRGEERSFELDLPPTDDLPVAVPEPVGLAQRLLETLAVAQRPLAPCFLRRAFSLSEAGVAEVSVELVRQGWVDVLFGRPDELGDEPQACLALRVAELPELTGERAQEITSLLATALDDLKGRGGQGRAWLRLQASLATDPARAPALARQLVSLAERDNEPLLRYAAYESLIDAADETRPRLEDRCQAALTMGEQHRLSGDLDRAAALFRAGLDAVEASGGHPSKRLVPLAAELILKMAYLARDRNKHQETHRLISEALERYEEDLPAFNRGRLYLDLSGALFRLGRTREAASYCELVLKILDAERYPNEVARAYNQLGGVQYEESNYSQSLINWQRALVLCEQAGDAPGVARSYNNLSLTYRSLGRLAEAERCLKRSLEVKLKTGDTRGVAITQLNLGLLAIDQGNFEQARSSAAECLHVARRYRNRQMEAEAYGLLGDAAMGEGKYEEARDLLLRDLEICRASSHETERLATLRRLVGLLLELGELDAGQKRLDEAKVVLEGVPSRYEAAMLSTYEAELSSRAGDLEPAIHFLTQSARGFGAMRRFDLQLDCLARRAGIELELSRSSDARRSYLEARDLAARHEIHRVPERLQDLSARIEEIQPGAAIVSSEVDHRMEALADLLGPGGDMEAGRPEGALRAASAALGTDQVYWVRTPRNRSLGVVRGEVVTGNPSDELAPIVAQAESDRVPGSFREDNWVAVRIRGTDVGWLAARRDRPLDDGEFAFLQSLAGILSMASGVSGPPVRREAPQDEGPQPGADFGIIGNSPELQAVLRMVEMVKDNEVTILILGENGTGKDLVARAIHQAGPRAGKEMVAVNCASIPSSLLESELFGHEKGAFTSAVDRRIGIFERANGGTVFLDEIGEMPMAMQAKLLRVLQDQTFTRVGGSKTISTNVRVIAATNKDLSEEVEQGRFRMDLFYRLNVISMSLPPLRERKDDIKPLVHHFLRQFADEFRRPVRGITDEAIERLKECEWPGNIRELENALKKAIVFAGREILRVEDMPEVGGMPTRAKGSSNMEEAVRAVIEGQDYSEDRPLMPRLELILAYEVVRAVSNKTRAAQLLGITKPTLYNRLRRYMALYGPEAGKSEADVIRRARG